MHFPESYRSYDISKDRGRALEFIEMKDQPDFKEYVDKLRGKWNIDVDYFESDDAEVMDTWMSFQENNDLVDDVEKMLKELKISPSWQDVVHTHVIDGDVCAYNDFSDDITSNSEGLVLIEGTDMSGEIFLKVGPDTILADFETAWDKIKRIRNISEKRRTTRKNALRDLHIFHMAKRGKTIVEISSEVREKYREDLDYGLIKKVVADSYDRRNIPKTERPVLRTK